MVTVFSTVQIPCCKNTLSQVKVSVSSLKFTQSITSKNTWHSKMYLWWWNKCFVSWQKSAAVSAAAPEEETDGRPLPPGWRSYTSPEGQRYYVNSCSKGERHTWEHDATSGRIHIKHEMVLSERMETVDKRPCCHAGFGPTLLYDK